jgi:hypothetical protein
LIVELILLGNDVKKGGFLGVVQMLGVMCLQKEAEIQWPTVSEDFVEYFFVGD